MLLCYADATGSMSLSLLIFAVKCEMTLRRWDFSSKSVPPVSPGKTGLLPCRGLLPMSDGRSMELGCAVVLSFLGQLCTDDAQSTVRGSLDLRHAFHRKNILFIYFLCYPCNRYCPGLHFFIRPSENCLEPWSLRCQASALSLIMPAFLCAASHFSISQGPCYHTSAVFLYTTSLC